MFGGIPGEYGVQIDLDGWIKQTSIMQWTAVQCHVLRKIEFMYRRIGSKKYTDPDDRQHLQNEVMISHRGVLAEEVQSGSHLRSLDSCFYI